MSERSSFGVETSADRRPGFDRRRFVSLVTAGVAGGWLADNCSVAWAATVATPSGSSLVPGYLRFSDEVVGDDEFLCSLSDFRTPLYNRLRPLLPVGRPVEFVSSVHLGGVPHGFASGRARIWVHGLLPPDSVAFSAGLDAIHLHAEVDHPKIETSPRHYVWGFCQTPVANLSGATSFEVPVDDDTTVRLVMSFEAAPAASFGRARNVGTDFGGREGGVRSVDFATEFTLMDRYGEPRLRPGIYCLPLNDEAQKAFPLVANRDFLVPDNLPYLLFSVQELE